MHSNSGYKQPLISGSGIVVFCHGTMNAISLEKQWMGSTGDRARRPGFGGRAKGLANSVDFYAHNNDARAPVPDSFQPSYDYDFTHMGL